MAGKLRKLTMAQVTEAVAAYDGGASLAVVAKRFSVFRQSMHDLLKRRTTMRPQKRYGADNHFERGGATATDAAHNAVEHALKRGVLVNPGCCEVCGRIGSFRDGRTAIQAHHDDYNHPLRVRWLCQKCHHEWHKTNTAIAFRADQ